MKSKNYALLIIFILLIFPINIYAQTAPILPKAEQPFLVTSAGQGPGAEIVNVLARRNKIENRLVNNATVIHLENMKTLIVALSSSLKGMGAAGVSIEQELTRLDALITEAKKRRLIIIGTHLEGEARRGGYDEVIIEKIATRMDYLIVRNDGNADGIFNQISKTYNIPLFLIDKTLEFSDILIKIFVP